MIDADDDGFVSPKMIMRMLGSTTDDLRILVAKGFVIPFEDGVIVIRHWRVNNEIRQDRYKETQYKDHKERLGLTNGIYDLVLPMVPPTGDILATQVRLGKVRKDTPAEARSAEAAALEASPFDFTAYLQSMRDNKQRHIQIIARFFYAKGLIFDNEAQVQAAIRRHLRSAKSLTGFANEQIDGAIQKVERHYPDIEWTLETLVKVLTK